MPSIAKVSEKRPTSIMALVPHSRRVSVTSRVAAAAAAGAVGACAQAISEITAAAQSVQSMGVVFTGSPSRGVVRGLGPQEHARNRLACRGFVGDEAAHAKLPTRLETRPPA